MLVALVGVPVTPTQIPVEFKHCSHICVPLQEGAVGALKGECFSAFVTFWLRERVGIIGLDRSSQRGPRTPRIVPEDGHIAVGGEGKEDGKGYKHPFALV